MTVNRVVAESNLVSLVQDVSARLRESDRFGEWFISKDDVVKVYIRRASRCLRRDYLKLIGGPPPFEEREYGAFVRTLEFANVAVTPDYQRLGLGGLLLDWLMTTANEHKLHFMVEYVFDPEHVKYLTTRNDLLIDPSFEIPCFFMKHQP